jgi:hypothetical protein
LLTPLPVCGDAILIGQGLEEKNDKAAQLPHFELSNGI